MTTTGTMTGTTTRGTMTDTPRPAPRRASGLGASLSSTRLRLAAALVAVTALAGVLVVAGVRTVLIDQLEDRASDALAQEYQEFRRFLSLGRDERGRRVDGDIIAAGRRFLQRSVLEPDEVVVVADARGNIVESPAPPAGMRLGDDGPLLDALTTDNGDVRIRSLTTMAGPALALAVPVLRDGRRDGTFIVAIFTDRQRDQVDDALGTLIAFTALSVLLAALASWWVAGRLLRPLRVAADTARSISEHDLSRRMEDPGGRDEIATLVRTFNALLDRLEDALRTQRVFLADTGHDLRTPLTVIRGNLEQIRQGLVPEGERDEVLDMVQEEVDRMSRLVDDLVLLARSQRPDFLRIGPVDLADLAVGVVRRAETLPGPVWRARPGAGVVAADAERLTQAALNLATNAARYSPPGMPVVVGTELRGDHAVLWVADSGPGVPPEERERIFERHARGPERRASGSGLGLAIARAIAEAHGGGIELLPDDGRGACFVIRIPVTGKPQERSAA